MALWLFGLAAWISTSQGLTLPNIESLCSANEVRLSGSGEIIVGVEYNADQSSGRIVYFDTTSDQVDVLREVIDPHQVYRRPEMDRHILSILHGNEVAINDTLPFQVYDLSTGDASRQLPNMFDPGGPGLSVGLDQSPHIDDRWAVYGSPTPEVGLRIINLQTGEVETVRHQWPPTFAVWLSSDGLPVARLSDVNGQVGIFQLMDTQSDWATGFALGFAQIRPFIPGNYQYPDRIFVVMDPGLRNSQVGFLDPVEQSFEVTAGVTGPPIFTQMDASGSSPLWTYYRDGGAVSVYVYEEGAPLFDLLENGAAELVRVLDWSDDGNSLLVEAIEDDGTRSLSIVGIAADAEVVSDQICSN